MNRNHDIWSATAKQRLELANFLQTLTSPQWNIPSLCEGWLVRDVVAHLVLESRYDEVNAAKELVKHKLNLNKFMFSTAQKWGKNSSHQLVNMLREDESKRIVPFMVKPQGVLADLLVHELDIRIPLSLENELNKEALELVFNAFSTGGFGIGELLVGLHKNIKGLKLIATDIHWQKGDSKIIVEGKAQDLLMAIAGRRATLANLSGNGVDILASRID